MKLHERLYQTVAQSPDADLLLIGAIGCLFTNEREWASPLLGFASAKQYIWGWLMNNKVKEIVKRRNRQRSIEALKKKFITEGAPCDYFGARYAIKNYERGLEKTLGFD